MVYTHNFEIIVSGISIEGEITFDHGSGASFKTTDGEEMTILQHGQIQKLFEALVKFNSDCADIDKLEITKKP